MGGGCCCKGGVVWMMVICRLGVGVEVSCFM